MGYLALFQHLALLPCSSKEVVKCSIYCFVMSFSWLPIDTEPPHLSLAKKSSSSFATNVKPDHFLVSNDVPTKSCHPGSKEMLPLLRRSRRGRRRFSNNTVASRVAHCNGIVPCNEQSPICLGARRRILHALTIFGIACCLQNGSELDSRAGLKFELTYALGPTLAFILSHVFEAPRALGLIF